MSLNEADRKVVVEKSLDNSKRMLAEVPILMENKLYGIVAGRLYYACYHAVSALLVIDKFKVKNTHKGTQILLLEEYVEKGKLSEDIHDTYAQLGTYRNLDNYGDWKIVTEEKIKSLIEPARELINSVENLIAESLQRQYC